MKEAIDYFTHNTNNAMATPINGNDLKLYVGSDATRAGTETGAEGERIPFAQSQSVSLDLSDAVIDVTTKSSESFREIISGQITGSLSFDGLMDDLIESSTTFRTASTALGYFLDREPIFWEFGVADARVVGSGMITNLTNTAGVDDAAVYSGTIESTGVITFDADVAS